MERIRVIIVDDHPIYAEGLRAILSAESDFDLAGLARNGLEAIQLTERTRPEVVVLDVRLPGMSGAEVAHQIKQRHPEVQILALSGFDDDELVFSMIKAGATGYVLKDASPADIAQAIRNIHQGDSQLTPSITRKVLQQFAVLAREQNGTSESLYDGLTNREIEVLRLVASAKSNKEVASELCISERTVENHIHNIYQKLQIHDRTQAMLYAVRKGLVNLET